MPISKDRILSLIKEKLATMDFSATVDASEPNHVEQRIVDNLMKTVSCFDLQDSFFCEEDEELYESTYKSEEFEPVYEDFYEDSSREVFSYEYICKVLDYKEAHPNHTMKTISSKFRLVKNSGYLTKFRAYRDQQGTYREKLIKVAQFCKEKFDEARSNGVIVHDRTIRSWALLRARELAFTNFHASHWWINKFKRVYRIASRRIVKFVTYKQQRNQEEIEDEAIELLLDFQDNVFTKYDPTEVFNTDQSGFNYIVHTNRTLSNVGEQMLFMVYKIHSLV